MQPYRPADIARLAQHNLEAFWLHCLFTVGKNADTAAAKVMKVLVHINSDHPFTALSDADTTQIGNTLRICGTGQYSRLTRAVHESCKLDLKTVALEELEAVYGVGPKTARFFLVYARQEPYVILDTHILAWLRDHNVDAPLTSPPHNQYLHLERVALALFRAHYPGLDTWQVDALLWAQASGRLQYFDTYFTGSPPDSSTVHEIFKEDV